LAGELVSQLLIHWKGKLLKKQPKKRSSIFGVRFCGSDLIEDKSVPLGGDNVSTPNVDSEAQFEGLFQKE